MSNAAENRKIKADRVYKTIGKMSWQRVLLGIALLILIFFLSGVASELFFKGGHYQLAEHSMISDKWMEKNKPDAKKLIDAGYLYSTGDAEGAYELVCSISTDEFYRMNAMNYSNFCTVLADYYDGTDIEKSEQLLSMAEAADEFLESEDPAEE